MKPTLIKFSPEFYYYENGVKKSGSHPYLKGDVSGLTGDCSNIKGIITQVLSGDTTGIRGDITNIRGIINKGLRGDVSNISGDISGIKGDVSDLSGNFDECELTQTDRERGVHAVNLIRKS